MRLAAIALTLAIPVGCSSDSDPNSQEQGGASSYSGGGSHAGGTALGTGASAGSTSDGGSDPSECGTIQACDPSEVAQAMNLQEEIAPGLIQTQADGTGWIATVDATAGGAFAEVPDSFVYARFSTTGLEKVDLGDMAATESTGWDIAFRRYAITVNGGSSGPGCVTAARIVGVDSYDDLTSVPEDALFRTDEYLTESCELIPDGSGLPNSPATALSSFWTYPGCLQMTHNLFVVRRENGETFKLEVLRYYSEESQTQCDESGSVPMEDNGAANIVLRFASIE